MRDQLFGYNSAKYRATHQNLNAHVLLGLLICLKSGSWVSSWLNQDLKWHAIAQYKLYFKAHAPW